MAWGERSERYGDHKICHNHARADIRTALRLSWSLTWRNYFSFRVPPRLIGTLCLFTAFDSRIGNRGCHPVASPRCGRGGLQTISLALASGASNTIRAPTLWRGHAMPLPDRANNILPLLLADERLAHGDIAFVAHSFGGLILEQLLRVAIDRSPREPHVAAFVQRVSRLTFLGTPHRGASLATYAGILRLLLRPSSAAKGIARNDPNLRELNRWFSRYAVDEGIAIQTLIETKKNARFFRRPARQR